MAKRVSVKGRGADLFFAEEVPRPQPAVISEADPSALVEPSNDESKLAYKQESKKASLHTSKPATQRDSASQQQKELKTSSARDSSEPTSSPNPLAGAALEMLWDAVSERATVTNSFRYTEDEMERLNDALYDLTKRSRTKLTKQDMARLGLNAVLWDYEARGDASLLAQFAARRTSKR